MDFYMNELQRLLSNLAIIKKILNPTKAKKKLPPKYRIVDLNSIIHMCAGRGITPKIFQQYFSQGHSKESCM